MPTSLGPLLFLRLPEFGEREVKLVETLTHKSRRRRRSAYLAAVAAWGEREKRARAHGEGSQASSPEQPAYEHSPKNYNTDTNSIPTRKKHYGRCCHFT
jgi:hypothetical protein